MTASGYTRQSATSIASGQPIASTPVNNEFNQLQAAFSGTSGHDHSGGTGLGPGLGASAFGGLTSASVGFASANGANSFNCRTLTGTANQITITNGTGLSGDPVFSIATGYVGQASLTTLGTIATGVWHGTVIAGTYGGTGVNNGANTLTLGGTLTTSGASALTLTTTGATNVTLPTTGTLVNDAVTTLSSLASIGTISTGVWHGTVVAATYGGTGVNNSSSTITLAGSLATSGAFGLTFTTTTTTNVTLPASGTLLSSTNNLSDVGSAATARTNLLPTQTGNSGKFLTTDGAGTITWGSVSGASGGTVTSVTFTGDGVVLSSTPSTAVTASGTLTAALKTATGGTILGNNTGSTASPAYTAAPVLGIAATTAGTLGLANGGGSGQVVTLKNLGATSAYNFNLPTAAGTSGQVLASGGGVSTSMTWTTLDDVATSGSAADLQTGTLLAARMPALTGDVTTSAGAVATTVAKIAGVTVSSTTGTTNVVFSASPTLTGTPLAPTATATTNTTQIATTAYVQTNIATTASWTPALKFGGASVGMTYSTQTGTYCRIGKNVIAEFSIALTAKGSSTGAATITGIPVAALGNGLGIVHVYQSLAGITGSLYWPLGASTLTCTQGGTTGQADLDQSNFTDTSIFKGSIVYISS